MAKKVQAYIKLQVPAGQANPSPPVGPALGQHGVNIMEFWIDRADRCVSYGYTSPDYLALPRYYEVNDPRQKAPSITRV
jgi:hypothetical protein